MFLTLHGFQRFLEKYDYLSIVLLYYITANESQIQSSKIELHSSPPLGGDTLLKIPATISFGEIYGENEGEVGPVPFRTIVMLLSIVLMAGLSWATDYAFTKGGLSLEYDFLNCFKYG